MYCPLKETELRVEKCPVPCMYRDANGECKHNELAYEEDLNPERIAEILLVPLEDIEESAKEAKRRIQVALALEEFLGFANKTVIKEQDPNVRPIYKLFNITVKDLKKILNKETYQKWKEMMKVDISFQEICELFEPKGA